VNGAMILQAAIAGLFFSVWPLLMNRSGLPGMHAAFIFVLIQLLIITPLVISGLDSNMFNRWSVAASIFASIGLLIFTNGLEKISPKEVSNFFVIVLVVQVCVPAIYQVVLTGITPQRALGFAAALIAAILLK